MAAPATSADFHQLYEAELDYVWTSLRRLGVPSASVEDLAHDVFITAWKKFGEYDRARPIRPWLFGIAYRMASDFRSRAYQHREVPDDDADAASERTPPDGHVERTQARLLVAKALEAIPMERRGVFVMHELEGEGIPQVADALGIPLNTAYSRLRLARKDFAGAVEQLKGGA
jgi:RNA polymerase sigma-70 factor (ECF subfamily)